MTQPDVVLIGGGVIGLTTALKLAERGVSVTILERRATGREASWAGAGMLPPGNLSRAQTPEGERFEWMPFLYGNFRAGWQSGQGGYSVTLAGVYATNRVILSSSTATEFQLGPRLDLRLGAAGPLGPIRGLRWRAALGFDTNPRLPYAVSTGTDTASTYVLYPAQPRLFGFVGLQYEHAGP